MGQQTEKESQLRDDGLRLEYHWLLEEIFFWVYHILVIIMGTVILTKLLFAHYAASDIYQTDSYRYAQETSRLWAKGYIIDIKAVNTNNCPQGYQTLIDYNWSGINQGCYCSATIVKHKLQFLLKGTCSSQLIDEGCQDVNELNAQPLQIWKGGKLLCQKRVNALSFFTSHISKTVDGVSMNKCAQQEQYAIYTLQNIQCPISIISNKSVGTTTTTLDLDSVNNHQLHYTSQLGYPIAQFKLTEFQFCPFFQQINISPNKSGNYKLQIQSKTQTCYRKDPRMVQFDQFGELDFYNNNTRTKIIIVGIYDRISQLPGYPAPSNSYRYKLGYLKYPSWSYQCRISQTHSLNAANHHILFQTPPSALNISLIIAIPIIFLFAFFIRIFFIVRHAIQLKQRLSYNVLLLTDEEISERIPVLAIRKQFGRQFFIFLFEILLRLSTLFALIYSLVLLIRSSLWIKSSFQQSCTDSFIQGILRDYQSAIDYMSQLLIQAVIVWIILFVIDIAYFVVRLYKGDLVTRMVKQTQKQQIYEDEKSVQIKAMDESSEGIVLKDKQQMHVYDIDNIFMFDEQNSDENFYKSVENIDSAISKKKKKKSVRRKKNLFTKKD